MLGFSFALYLVFSFPISLSQPQTIFKERWSKYKLNIHLNDNIETLFLDKELTYRIYHLVS